MPLITRLTRLFRADLHAVLDRIEEPDVLLKQAVREMEEALDRDEQRLRGLVRERDQVLAREAELDGSLGEVEEEIEVCFASGEDDLVRALIKRRLEAERLRKLLVRKRETLEATLSALRRGIGEKRPRLEAMRQRAELLAEEADARRAEEGWPVPDVSVRDEEVEVAFLREKQRRMR
jgi:phage shock protein A